MATPSIGNIMTIGPVDSGNIVSVGLNEFRIGTGMTAGLGIAIGPASVVGKATGSSNKTAAFRMYADDGGVALTAAEYRVGSQRTLITASTSAGVSLSHIGQVKIDACSVTGSGNIGGLCGYLELTSGAHIGGGAGVVRAGVWGRVDLPTGAVIDASTVLAAFATGYNDLGGTHTGTAAVINVAAPQAGTWDSLINVAATSGCYVASDVGAAANKKLLVSVDGTQYAVKLYAVS